MEELDRGWESVEFGPSLSAVHDFWREFDLDSRRAGLDEIGLKIAQHQEEAVINRRTLAESTRDFRRRVSDSVVRSVGDLLKQYQQEVDRLTKRAKHGESAFLELYQKLYEAPDPAPSLASTLQSESRVLELEKKVQRQAKELDEFKEEAEGIRNQALTIRRLEEKIRGLEGELGNRDEEIRKVKSEVSLGRDEEVEAKLGHWKTLYEQSQENLDSLRRQYQASQDQAFAIQSKTEEERASHRSELELAISEIEQLQERILVLETERKQLSNGGGGNSSRGGDGDRHRDDILADIFLKDDLERERAESRQLAGKVGGLEKELEGFKEMMYGRMQDSEETVRAKDAQIKALESELAARPTGEQVEDLKHQLKTLQAVQYSLPDMDENPDPDSSLDVNPHDTVHSMERMLLQKNRHLEHEITMLKLTQAELKQKLAGASARVGELEGQLEAERNLVVKLEEDLFIAQEAKTREERTGGSEGDDILLSEFGNVDDEVDETQTMVGVLQSQRDRFRKRVHELEEDLAKCQVELSRVRSGAKSVHADNVALIERIQFLQGYRNENMTQLDIESQINTEKKYAKVYEERMNPFNEFQGRQRDNRKKKLGIVDRSVYVVGELVFGNRYARLFVFFYVILLHVLVMSTLLLTSHKHGAPHLMDPQEVRKMCEEFKEGSGAQLSAS